MNKRLQKNNCILLLLIAGIFFSSTTFSNIASCRNILDKSMCEKIGQMLIIGFGGFKQDKENGQVLWNDVDSTNFNENSLIAKHIANDHIGGVILFLRPLRDIKTKKFIRDRNIQSPAQVAKLNQDLQNFNNQMRKKQGLSDLPLFISVDQEGGGIDRLPASLGFPVRTILPQALGAKEEEAKKKKSRYSATKETYDYTVRLAQEISDAHFNLNFAPVVDVNINPTNPIIGGLGRSFSSDPQVVVNQAKQFVQAFHEYGIVSALKHFPGHGSSSGDSHEGLVDVTQTYDKSKELYPYYKLIQEGYDDVIMTTHVINGQIDQNQCKIGQKGDRSTWCPGTMSQKTLDSLLRKKMGFKGLIISDDMTMDAIAKQYSLRESLKKAVNAGVDIFIIANNEGDQTNEVIVTLAELVKCGGIKRERIDEVYARITGFKKSKLGKRQN
jgi:beta-N-acetylhexosaminidase